MPAGSSGCWRKLGFELWIGDPAQIKAKRVRKQKTDRLDAALLLQRLLENRFPRLWVPSRFLVVQGSSRITFASRSTCRTRSRSNSPILQPYVLPTSTIERNQISGQ